MKAGGGRLKGNAFERTVAKMIVAAFEDAGITLDDCYRTPGSGGHPKASKTDPADLVISRKLRKYFNFSVECKFYKDLDWHRLMTTYKNKGHFSVWWDQCVRSATAAKGNSVPLLVFRKNRGETYCMYPVSMEDHIVSRIPFPNIRTRVNGQGVRIVLFTKFLESKLGGHNAQSPSV